MRETWGPCEGGFIYRASEGDAVRPDDGRWRPSIHMPRWASRITLEITEVRVERVQAITMRDAEAEGYPFVGKYDPDFDATLRGSWGDGSCAAQWFRRLWDSINAARGHGWDANPWVWVVGFKVTSTAACAV